VTGVNLPMLIKLASLREAGDLLASRADARARTQRHLGGLRPAARRQASRGARDEPRTIVVIRNPLGLHARAAARFVHLAAALPVADVRVGRDGRTMDGKSIMGMLLLEIQEGDTLVKREMAPGEAVHITPKTVHRMTAIEDSDIFEVSTPELHDVVRLEDRYGRAEPPG
jgi:phosphotransferase system HPr (HPr) family protein